MSQCHYDNCDQEATRRVRFALDAHWYCARHAALVRDIEREWGDAERDYYEQSS